MRKVLSTGGVVIKGNKVLMLKKKNGSWVLPKGRVEQKETLEDAAVREVWEETGINAHILKKLGTIRYTYRDYFQNGEMVNKSVVWYLMEEVSGELKPLEKEGFIDCRYMDENRVDEVSRFKDEREMIHKALRGN